MEKAKGTFLGMIKNALDNGSLEENSPQFHAAMDQLPQYDLDDVSEKPRQIIDYMQSKIYGEKMIAKKSVS